MTRSFLSSDWYRVAALTPRLRGHVEIHRQRFRGATWHVIEDRQNGRHHRVSPAVNLMLNLMDGRRTVHELWQAACARFEDAPPTQDDVIRLLSQLHRSDLIAGAAPPDLQELGRRAETQARQSLMQKLRNPLALRLPLLDPDRFLDATAWILRPLFTVWGFLAWLALVAAGGAAVAMNWAALAGAVTDQVLTAQNLILLALVYPVVKTVHELGHAYAAKVWGGEVHEIGLMFLVLIPVPYVDASASSAFAEKWRRAVVGGAGIMVELALAAAAALFWISAEPGLARAFAFNVMLIGGASTLFFNGNPLLRFDGYFVLCDVIEIPNLGTRANRHVLQQIRARLLGVKGEDSPVTAPGERGWFVGYAVCAFVYRMMIAIAISLFIASKFFVIGVMLAIWSLSATFLLPVLKGLWWLVSSPQLRGRRGRAMAATGCVLGLAAALLFMAPAPYATVAQGVVLLDEGAYMRAGAAGFVREVAPAGGMVSPGDAIVLLEDPVLTAQARLAAARLAEMRLRREQVRMIDRVQEDILAEQVGHLEQRLADIETRRAALRLIAERPGRLITPDAADLAGRHVRKGDVLAYVLDDAPLRLRVAVPEAEADLVRSRTIDVQVILARDPAERRHATLLREAPGGGARLPSRALSTDAGGVFPLDPRDPDQQRTLGVVFQFDVALSENIGAPMVGERAYVRFDHGTEPVAFRFYRSVRQLFLSQFNV